MWGRGRVPKWGTLTSTGDRMPGAARWETARWRPCAAMLRRRPIARQEARGAGASLVLQLEVLEGRGIPEAGNAARAFVGYPRPHAPDEGLLEEGDGDDLVAHDDALDIVHHRLALLRIDLPRLAGIEIVDLG